MALMEETEENPLYQNMKVLVIEFGHLTSSTSHFLNDLGCYLSHISGHEGDFLDSLSFHWECPYHPSHYISSK